MITYFRWNGSLHEVSPAYPAGHLAILDLLSDFGVERSLGDRFRQLDPVHRAAPAILFRSSSTWLLDAIDNDAVLRSQLAGREVGALVPLEDLKAGSLAIHSLPALPPLTSQLELNDLRELETRFLFRDSGAVLQLDRAHFALPNRGTHSPAFVQISYVLRDAVNLERLSDWLSPYISSTTAVLADTAHLLGLLQRLRLSHHKRFDHDLPVATLPSYPPEHTLLHDEILKLTYRGHKIDNILLVLSVNASGRLANLFWEVCPSDLRPQIVALCHAKDRAPDPRIDCFATLPVPRWTVNETGQCPKCRELETIFVDPETFECKPEQEPAVFKPDMRAAERDVDFWQWVSQTEAVTLHVGVEHHEDGQTRQRHHGIYFHIDRLLGHSEFRQQCLEQLREIERPDLVIIPQHAQSDLLRALALEAHSNVRVQITPGQLDPAIKEDIATATKILLLDDSFVTGSTLLGLNNQIYHAAQQLYRDLHVEVFVVLARPNDPDWKRHVVRPFFGEDRIPHVKWGHLLYVPKPGPDRCPWCEERTFLEKSRGVVSAEGRAYLDRRIRLLEGTFETVPLFAPSRRLEEHLLTQGSFFGTLDENTAFAAASCIAHELGNKVDGHRGLFVRPQVDLSLVVDGYYDTVFLAGMLRTLRVRHLRTAGFESSFVERLSACPAELSYPGTVGEIAWAAVQGKVAPQPAVNLLNRANRPDSALSMLRQLIDRNGTPDLR